MRASSHGGTFNGILLGLVVVTVGLFLVINFSGFLPADQHSKTALCRTWFRSLEFDVKEFILENHGELPKSWDHLVDPDEQKETNYLMDPFTGYRSRLKAKFEEDIIVIWSVGVDGTDSLRIDGDQIERDDELVFVLIRNGEGVEARMEGF